MKQSKTVAAMAALAIVGSASAQEFSITWTNLGPQPLSPLFFAASNNSFDIFQVGGSASQGIKDIAETGDVSAMLGIADAAGSAVGFRSVLGGGPLMPGFSRSGTFSATSTTRWFSFATMLGMTNDGFLGESVSSMSLDLYDALDNPTGFSLTIMGSRAWDAGTEDNTQDAADLAALGGSGNPPEMSGNDMIRVHAGIIAGHGDSWASLPAWQSATELTRIEVTPVPEPSTLLVAAAGLGAFLRRRRPN